MKTLIAALCVIAILFIMFNLYLLLKTRDLRNDVQFLHDQCEVRQDLIDRTILSDDLIESSIDTVCEAYKIEKGDLKNYISRRQNANGTVTDNK